MYDHLSGSSTIIVMIHHNESILSYNKSKLHHGYWHLTKKNVASINYSMGLTMS